MRTKFFRALKRASHTVISRKKLLRVLVQVMLLQSHAYAMDLAYVMEAFEKGQVVPVNSEFLNACKNGDSARIISLLAQGAHVNAKDNNGATALHYAAWRGHREIVALLIKKGADVNLKTNAGTTALHIAAQEGHKEIVDWLILNGAEINAKTAHGETALHIATVNGHKGVATLVISHGADVRAKVNGDVTALHLAAWKGHKEIVELLIANGAEVNAQTDDGKTALHVAVNANHKEIVELLILNGADVSIKDKKGSMPFTHASYVLKNILHRALLFQRLLLLMETNKRLLLSFDQSWFASDYLSTELNKLVKERKILLNQEIQNKWKQAEKASNISLPLLNLQLPPPEDSPARFFEKHIHEFNAGLALDGEGLQVLTTVSMIKKLEEELKYSVHELFDCIAGSSLGGILALGLVASKESNYRLIETDDLIKLFEGFPHDILRKKLQRKNKFYSAYDDLKQQINALFKNMRLSNSLTRVIVPCTKEHKAYDFDSREALKRQAADCPLGAVACALAVDPREAHLSAADLNLLGKVTASSEYKNKSAELLLKKMKSSLDENQRGKLHILYCASNPLDEGHNRVHDNLIEELSVERYRRIKPKNNDIGSFDGKDLVALYKEKGETAAEQFLKGNKSFIRKLQENRANKHCASY